MEDIENGQSICPPPYNRKAFTLSEVLITLVVIGIVAAMTVPTIIANHKKEEVETRLKKFYTAVYNAHRLENINGNYMVDSDEPWTWFQKNIVEKHLNVAKYYEKKIEENVVVPNVYYFSDGSRIRMFGGFATVDGRACAQVIFDINGDKGPNKIGKDHFRMPFCEGATPKYINYFSKTYGYSSHSGFSRNTYMRECKDGDNFGNEGPCFALIKMNGFKIPDDYPVKI